ncbi:Maelstrom domain-containing protein [Entamoeba marina]
METVKENPRCQRKTPTKPTQRKNQKKGKQTTQKNNSNPQHKDILATLDTISFHFYDFEYAGQNKTTIYPIEIGISTYKLHLNEELDNYHKLLYPGPFNPSFNHAKKIHGIDAKDSRLEKNYGLVAMELIEYCERHGNLHVFVSKEQQLSGDKKCVEDIFKKATVAIPNSFRFITHIQLFDLIARKYNLKCSENPTFFLNHIFKQLHCSKPCQYHSELDPKFHCALSDARNTALMMLIALKHFNIQINQSENLPETVFVKSTWELDTTVLVTNASYYFTGEPSEVIFSFINFGKDTQISFNEQKVFHFLPKEMVVNDTFITRITEDFKMNNKTNDSVIDEMNSILDNFKSELVVVHLKSKLSKALPQLHTTSRLCLPEIEFQKQLFNILSSRHKTEKIKFNVFEAWKKELTQFLPTFDPCTFHKDSQNYCTSIALNTFIFWDLFLINNYVELHKKYMQKPDVSLDHQKEKLHENTTDSSKENHNNGNNAKEKIVQDPRLTKRRSSQESVELDHHCSLNHFE